MLQPALCMCDARGAPGAITAHREAKSAQALMGMLPSAVAAMSWYPARVQFTIERLDATDLEPCSCCGGRTRIVRGFVYRDAVARAAYIVRWAPGRPQHGAVVALSIGRWGGASASQRTCFTFDLRVQDRPGFMVLDAGASPFAQHEKLLGAMITRADALSSPLKQEAFDILDSIGQQDERVNGWWLDAQAH